MRNQMVIDACNGTHPLTRYGLAMEERTIRIEIPNGLPELVATFCKTGAANIWFSPLQIRKIPNGIP